MPTLETSHEFEGSIEDVYDGICSYERYPSYIPGVTSIVKRAATEKGSQCQVHYEINLIKTFYYTLNMFETSNEKINWTLADSNLMKKNNGSWTLKKLGTNKTLAIYTLDVAFKGLVPSMITDQVAKTSLPGMLEGMQKLIKEKKK